MLYNYITCRYGSKGVIVFRLITVLFVYIIPIVPDIFIFFRKIIIFLVIFSCLFISANAAEFTAPPAPETVQRYMPDETNNFAEGVHYVLRNALETLWPSVFEAAGNCISLVAVALITSVSRNFPFTCKRVMVLSQIVMCMV
mgnify:CR=1 FL=1